MARKIQTTSNGHGVLSNISPTGNSKGMATMVNRENERNWLVIAGIKSIARVARHQVGCQRHNRTIPQNEPTNINRSRKEPVGSWREVTWTKLLRNLGMSAT